MRKPKPKQIAASFFALFAMAFAAVMIFWNDSTETFRDMSASWQFQVFAVLACTPLAYAVRILFFGELPDEAVRNEEALRPYFLSRKWQIIGTGIIFLMLGGIFGAIAWYL